jgi:hypothetical protein
MNPTLMGEPSGPMTAWLIDKIGLPDHAVNVFVRKVGMLMEMFKRIDAANAKG